MITSSNPMFNSLVDEGLCRFNTSLAGAGNLDAGVCTHKLSDAITNKNKNAVVPINLMVKELRASCDTKATSDFITNGTSEVASRELCTPCRSDARWCFLFQPILMDGYNTIALITTHHRTISPLDTVSLVGTFGCMLCNKHLADLANCAPIDSPTFEMIHLSSTKSIVVAVVPDCSVSIPSVAMRCLWTSL